MEYLANPEQHWLAPDTSALDLRAEVERRIGRFDGELTRLSGGLANLSVRVGERGVLRVHLREPATAAKEAALLARAWRSFRVPALLERGADFVLIEYVAHDRLPATALHGAACGRALAEIHAVEVDEVPEADRHGDAVRAMSEHMRAHAEELYAALGRELGVRVLAFVDEHEPLLQAAAGAPVLLHGDFKASNLHWTQAGELLVLDWEFAWIGPRWMDVGQIMRWGPPPQFVDAFAAAYARAGENLPADWRRVAGWFDLFNLLFLAMRRGGERRASDLSERIQQTIRLG